ncbi:FAD:protein FMN transferase [Zunongwangia atlantica]|uniref:FAD:protein FMN transferase n=1 Tax=Zunongwangia atlantica 22II14-10F7 TaxID=1185767 RepID=A0A1Y1T666_9FLAO|nr:FAD:protein FMN transferase [Zunongwangia atlantica]ORL46202.1 thiamine biosynthesis lipoprotein [Zunongwangia atlantica 22II14-10F7]
MAGKKFRLPISIFVVLIACFFTACEGNEFEEQNYSGQALGTSYHIKIFTGKEDLQVEEGLDSIFKVINQSMSTYWDDSDISLINRGVDSIKIDNHFKTVFKASCKIYKETNGYFDPTVGNLVNAYGFGPDKRLDALDDKTIDSLLQYVGFDKLTLSSKGEIIKKNPKIYLDFNAIAKGYTIDVIASFFEGKGVYNYLIELGGELVSKGEHITKQKPFVVAIDDPLQEDGARTYQATLKLKNRAMATSGNYRKFRVDSITGERFVHTINPLTGKPERSNLLSASVLAESCMLADGYATAFMALGLEKAKKLSSKLDNIDVYFIYAENDSTKVYTSEGFQEVLISQ